MKAIMETLKEKPLLFDGGMGTYYKAAPGTDCEMANLTDPAGILAVHRAYVTAGCAALKTNTFNAAGVCRGDEELLQEVIAAGLSLARQAAGDSAQVFADIGPAPITETEQAAESYKNTARIFLENGAENFLFETLSTDAGVTETARWIKAQCPAACVFVSFAVQPDGFTREGLAVQTLVRRVQESGAVDAVGLNCVCGAAAMRAVLSTLRGIRLPLLAMPNAGYPVVARNRVVYGGKPEYFATELLEAARGGARILGGCCGTTPAHIAALSAALEQAALPAWAPSKQSGESSTAPAAPNAAPKSNAPESRFWQRLSAGKRVLAVELDPPKNADAALFMQGAATLRDAGIDLLTIADCPIARARMDSSLLACKVRRELGLDALPHMTCRDRNLNASKALLLGLSAEGVRQVLTVTGDPIPSAERDEVKSVYQFNSRKLAQYIVSLGQQELCAPFHVFGALNLNARNFEVELGRAQQKLENGMVGFLTQPVLSASALENLRRARAALPEAKLLAGILPVVSERNAIFMENEVNGIHVAPEIIALYAGADRARGEELGLTVSLEIAKQVLPFADGLYLMTPFNRTALMQRLIQALREALL